MQKSFFAADTLDGVINFDGTIVITESKGFQSGGERTNQGAEVTGIILEIGDGLNAGVVKDSFGNATDAVNGANGQGTQKLYFAAFRNQRESIRFFEVAGKFREKFVGSDADGGGQLALGKDALLEGAGNGHSRFKGGVIVGEFSRSQQDV